MYYVCAQASANSVGPSVKEKGMSVLEARAAETQDKVCECGNPRFQLRVVWRVRDP